MEYKDLKLKAKLEHIWEYYRFHIIGILFAVIMIVWISATVWENKNRVYALDVTIIGAIMDMDATANLQKELEDYFKEKGIIGEVSVDAMDLKASNPDQLMANNARFMAKTSSNEIDVLIALGEPYKEFVEAGLYYPLDELIRTGELQIEDDLKMINTTEDLAEEKVYGIDISMNPRFVGVIDPENGFVISITANSKKIDNAIEAVKYIIQ